MLEKSVDILVIFYNQQDYVDKALGSIFEQKTSFEIRVLVGDDGSSDGTLKKVEEWAEKHPGIIQVYCMERNDGIAVPGFRASRNRINLLEQVESEYFIFLDGDDYFTDRNKLQKQYDILEKKENSDCVMCAHNIAALFKNGESKVMVDSLLKEGKYSLKKYWPSLYFHTDTMLIRSEVIKNLPLDLLENNFNDNLITYSVLQNGDVYYLPDVMAVYLQTGDGIWTSGNKVVNGIRNIFLYDLSIMINPKMKNATDIRLWYSWKMMWENKSLIKEVNLSPYLREAEDKNLEYSLLWIKYDTLDMGKRFGLLDKTYGMLFKAKFYNVLKRIKHLVGRRN